MKKLVALVLTMLMLVAVFTSMASAASKPIKIKFAYMPPELTPEECVETTIAYTFRDYLEEHFPDRFQVEIYPSGQLGSFAETYAGNSDGSIEISLVNVAAISTVDKNLNVWQIPGSISSLAQIRALLASEEAMATFDNVNKQTGTTILMGFSAGARHFTNNVREVKTPADMNGIVFRTMENPLYVKMVESMGGVAVPMASSEMYSALQNGVIQGQENPISSIIADMTYQVQDYLTLDGHVYSLAFMVCNTAWLNNLDPELQQGVKDAAKAAFVASNERVDALEATGLEFLKTTGGMQVYVPTEEELKAWHDQCYQGAVGYVIEQLGQEKVDEFMNLVNSVTY